MALLQDLISDLPAEPARAIVVLADRIREHIIRPAQKPGNVEDYSAIATFMLKFCQRYSVNVDFSELKAEAGLGFLSNLVTTINNNRTKILEHSIDIEIDELLVAYDAKSTASAFGSGRLNAEEKKKIHDQISRIRKLIQESDLPDRKKNALFERLNALAKEVDLHGTRTDRFFSFASDLGFVLGDFGKNAKPLFDEVRSMLQVVSRARARDEGVSLPPGDEPMRLPTPQNGE